MLQNRKRMYSLDFRDSASSHLIVPHQKHDMLWKMLPSINNHSRFLAPVSDSIHPPHLFFVLPLLPNLPPGATAAGERGAAEDCVRRREGGGHRLPRARSDAVLEGAADALRGLPGADHHGDGQAQVFRHGARPDHVDGLSHLSDWDGGEAQVSAARRMLLIFSIQTFVHS